MHAADMYLDVLQQLGVQDLSSNGLEIFPGEEHFLEAELFWQEQNITDQDKLIGFKDVYKRQFVCFFINDKFD